MNVDLVRSSRRRNLVTASLSESQTNLQSTGFHLHVEIELFDFVVNHELLDSVSGSRRRQFACCLRSSDSVLQFRRFGSIFRDGRRGSRARSCFRPDAATAAADLYGRGEALVSLDDSIEGEEEFADCSSGEPHSLPQTLLDFNVVPRRNC